MTDVGEEKPAELTVTPDTGVVDLELDSTRKRRYEFSL
jgi:hypothetical protein